MAQPPLSAAIRQLERDLGVDLFTRTTREVRLTDAGRAFLQGARRTLADTERAAEDAKRAAAGEEFVVFPREIAPRLHEAFMAVYRRAGFEPRVRNESFHTRSSRSPAA